MVVDLIKEYRAEVAHRSPADARGERRLHGHSIRILITVSGEVDPRLGWLIDFNDISSVVKPLVDQIDHSFLEDLPGLSDCSLTGLACWIEAQIAPGIPGLTRVRVAPVGECRFAPVRLEADSLLGLPARIRFTFEAAQQLPHLPEGHPCRNLHGHTYRVEAAAADLDALESALSGLYDELDHRCLNDFPELTEATSERICGWIWDRLARRVDGLTTVVVQETETARCIYHGE